MSETALATTGPQMVAFRSIDEVISFATKIAQSAFVPKDFRGKPGDVAAAIMYGLELGLTPMSALQGIAVINGKPSIFGDLLIGICLGHPSTEYIKEATTEEIEETGVAWCEAKRKGKEVVRRTFSKDDAERAHLLVKDIWKSYRTRMQQMRARGFCLRDAYADILKGIMSREEAQDIIDVTPESPHGPRIEHAVTVEAPERQTNPEAVDALLHAIDTVLQPAFRWDIHEERQKGMALIREVFGAGYKALKTLPVEELQAGYDELQSALAPPIEQESPHPEDDGPAFDQPTSPQASGEAIDPPEATQDAASGEDASEGESDGIEPTSEDQAREGYATKTQIAKLKELAYNVGEDAYTDVQDTIEYHKQGLPRNVHDLIKGRLEKRQVAKGNAPTGAA